VSLRLRTMRGLLLTAAVLQVPRLWDTLAPLAPSCQAERQTITSAGANCMRVAMRFVSGAMPLLLSSTAQLCDSCRHASTDSSSHRITRKPFTLNCTKDYLSGYSAMPAVCSWSLDAACCQQQNKSRSDYQPSLPAATNSGEPLILQ
jgi:hypothetical protein